jgi:ElaB/YqjD/DUF883 family membrane-anchored ribosome-binding protein
MALDTSKLTQLASALQTASAADAEQQQIVSKAQDSLTTAQTALSKAQGDHINAQKAHDAAQQQRNVTTAPALAAARKSLTDFAESAK